MLVLKQMGTSTVSTYCASLICVEHFDGKIDYQTFDLDRKFT